MNNINVHSSLIRDSDTVNNSIEFSEILSVIRRFWFFILLGTFTAAVATYYYVEQQIPVYEATSTLLIQPQNYSIAAVNRVVNEEIQSKEYYLTQFEILKSRSLAIQVIEKLDLWGDESVLIKNENAGVNARWIKANDEAVFERLPENAIDPASRRYFINQFLKQRKILPVADTFLVKTRFRAADPEKASEIADAFGEQYIANHLNTKMYRTQQATEWLSSRVSEMENALAESQLRLQEFRIANDLVDIGGTVSGLSEQQLLMHTQSLAQAQAELDRSNTLVREINSYSDDLELLLAIPEILGDPVIQRLKFLESELVSELEILGNRYGLKHPQILDVKTQLESIRQQIQVNVQRIVQSIEERNRTDRRKLENLRTSIVENRGDIQLLGEKRDELQSLKMEVETNQNLYRTFFNRLSETGSTEGLDISNASISDRAEVPDRPSSPRKGLALLTAVIAGFIGSYMLFFLKAKVEKTIDSTYELENKFGLASIASVPLIKTTIMRRKVQCHSLICHDKRFMYGMDEISTSLKLSQPNKECYVLSVTSSIPDEGKSSLCLGLAKSFGRFGRVLLLDGDLHMQSLSKNNHKYESRLPSLCQLREGIPNFAKLFENRNHDADFDFIPAGVTNDKPLEVLSSKEFKQIISALSEEYDQIIIDTPPLRAVSDAAVISRVCDCVLYVIQAHSTHEETISRGLSRLRYAQASNVLALLNKVQESRAGVYDRNELYEGYIDIATVSRSA